MTIKLEGSLGDLIKFIEAIGKGVEVTKEVVQTGKTVGKKTKRALNAWQKFLRDFVWRKKKKSESNAHYMGLRSKAASRAWKKLKKGSTKKNQVRKTARRAE